MQRSSCVLVLLALAGGCSAGGAGGNSKLGGRPTVASLPMVTCAEATRAAGATAQRLGYTLTNVKAAEPGQPGIVTGEKESGWSGYDPSSRGKELIEIAITCSDAGAEVEAYSNEAGMSGLGFGNRFKTALAGEVGQKKERARLESEKSRGLIIKVEPQRAEGSVAVFGADLPSAGVVPVRVELDNQSDRRYSFAADAVVLYSVQGSRETALSPEAAAQRLKSVSPQLRQALQQQALQPGELAAGQKVAGFLYFNASTYRRAQVTMIDADSDEPEGFSVRF